MSSGTMAAAGWTLERDSFGRLVLRQADGAVHEGVVPVRAFPIQAPQQGIGLVNAEGREVAWVASLTELAADTRRSIEEELAAREFMPVIQRVVAVSGYATPCTWTVDTDRGRTQFVLRGDEDIRRHGAGGTLLIADSHSIQYLVRDLYALDAHSRRILDRFM
ncbi:MAG: cyanophycin metabolism-associated DUF1854 family protein [Rhodoferax sp.]